MITTNFETFAPQRRQMREPHTLYDNPVVSPHVERVVDEPVMNEEIKPIRFNLCYSFENRHWAERGGRDVRIPEYEAGLERYNNGVSPDLELTFHAYKPTDPEKLKVGGRIVAYKTKQGRNDISGAFVMGVITGWKRSEDFRARTPEYGPYKTSKTSNEIKVYIRPITRVRPLDGCVLTEHQIRTFQNVSDDYWNILMRKMEDT